MKHSWLLTLLQWTIWFVLMSLIMGWLAKNRLRKQPVSSNGTTMVHPKSTLVIGIIGVVFCFGLAILTNTVLKNDTVTIWTTLGFICFGLLSIAVIMEYFFARHRATATGLEYGSMFGRRGTFKWPEVKQVGYSPSLKWFVLILRSGKKVRISAMLRGLPEFAILVIRYVPHERIDDDTLEVLRNAADGDLPGIWL